MTRDLDAGSITEQRVERVDHACDATAMMTAGQDVESLVLARAVTWAAERRILLNGTKTVVFRR